MDGRGKSGRGTEPVWPMPHSKTWRIFARSNIREASWSAQSCPFAYEPILSAGIKQFIGLMLVFGVLSLLTALR